MAKYLEERVECDRIADLFEKITAQSEFQRYHLCGLMAREIGSTVMIVHKYVTRKEKSAPKDVYDYLIKIADRLGLDDSANGEKKRLTMLQRLYYSVLTRFNASESQLRTIISKRLGISNTKLDDMLKNEDYSSSGVAAFLEDLYTHKERIQYDIGSCYSVGDNIYIHEFGIGVVVRKEGRDRMIVDFGRNGENEHTVLEMVEGYQHDPYVARNERRWSFDTFAFPYREV